MNNKRRSPRSLKPLNDKESDSFKDKLMKKSKIIKNLSDFFEIKEDRKNNIDNNLIPKYEEYKNIPREYNYINYLEEENTNNYNKQIQKNQNLTYKEKKYPKPRYKSKSKDLKLSKINEANIKNSKYTLVENNDINNLNYPKVKKEKRKSKCLNFFKGFTSKIEEYEKSGSFGFNLTRYEKNKMGIVIFIIFFLIIIGGSYYFFIYEPGLNELNKAKMTKLNQVNELFKGPLTSSREAIILEDEINHCNSKMELEQVDVLRPATNQWKDYHLKKINDSSDSGGRVMLSSTISNRKNIISVDEAKNTVLENDGYVLSNIEFEKPNTVAVPLQVSRLQACDGLIKTGSKIDIYCVNSTEIKTEDNINIENNSMNYNNTSSTNYTNQSPYNINSEISGNSTNETSISGCTVLAIIRSKESGTINEDMSETYSLNNDKINGSRESEYTYSDDVLEDLKTYAVNDSSEELNEESLNEYGIKLSEYERESNIGDLNCEYLLLIEIPRDDVQFTLNNMNNLILTIPTQDGPNWMIEEIKENNKLKNKKENFTIF